MIALGTVAVLRDYDRYWKATGVLVVSLLGTLFVLRTPLVFPGIQRLRLPVSLLVAVLIGLGIHHTLSGVDSWGPRAVPAMVAILLLSSSAHMTAATDLYGLHAGPSLWENQPIPETQKEFTEAEYRQLEEAARFTTEERPKLATDWASGLGLRRFDGEVSRDVTVTEEGFELDGGFLLYRQRWGERSQTVIPASYRQLTVVVTPEWLHDTVERENKVYTTGEVGILRPRGDDSLVSATSDDT
jgi:hypothetical protein